MGQAEALAMRAAKPMNLYLGLFALLQLPYALTLAGGGQIALAFGLALGLRAQGEVRGLAQALLFLCGAAALVSAFGGLFSLLGPGDALLKLLLTARAVGSFLLCVALMPRDTRTDTSNASNWHARTCGYQELVR